MSIGLNQISMSRAIAFFLLFISFVSYVDAEDVRVLAKGAKVENEKIYLDLQVWNCSGKKIELSLADLPWGQNTTGVVVYAAGQRGGEALPAVLPIADFPDTKVSVDAMTPVEGRVDLSARFPKLSQYRKLDDLVIFWVYDMSLIKGGHEQYVGGMVPVVGSSTSRKAAGGGCGRIR